ncbi:hypothetical protein CN692_18845 [Bacillus sp. AFS002410]|uniref:hypothetical protein n=1 Tax=Bacillus sp. AFS002410 TaxID=2033481 RepID=UPI000BF00D87|nr:hypothetical protein [Bacillus sp. AFS002410]PEJ56148.1 hypothetical protein CN692_18845 [Bacillus sp. AFS002410]QKE72824.1 hypothetical protein HPK19_08405 [Arthrobacter citreus]
MDKEKIEKFKMAGIILGTFVITLGIIISIAIINFNHAKAHPIVVKLPKSKSQIKLVDSIKVTSKLQTYECEVVELAKKENDEHFQIVCDSGKYEFTENQIFNKKPHKSLEIGDLVYLTAYEDGKLKVSIDSK